MNHRIHDVLDGELSRATLTPAEAAELAAAEAAIAGVLDAVPAAPLTDLSAGVLRRLEATERDAAARGGVRSLLRWMWRPLSTRLISLGKYWSLYVVFETRSTFSVPIGQDRVLYRPRNGNIRVVPRKSLLRLGGVKIAALVLNLGERGEDAEPVSEFRRNQQLPLVLGRKLHPQPTSTCRRGCPQINDNIPDFSKRTANQAPLWCRGVLEVKAA